MLDEKLLELEEDFLNMVDEPKNPTYFIVGSLRSGTTILMQLLTSTSLFGFVNNIIARYHLTPAAVTSILCSRYNIFDHAIFEEKSNFGQTSNPLSPHEFGYFWRRWLPIKDSDEPMEENIADSKKNRIRLKKTIASMEVSASKPFIFKNLRISMFIPEIKQAIPNSKFIWIKRDFKNTVRSVINFKKKKWGGGFGPIKPKNYSEIKGLDIIEQSVKEVEAYLHDIDTGLREIHPDDRIELSYEDLCNDTIGNISNILDKFGLSEKVPESLPKSMRSSNYEDKELFAKIDQFRSMT